MSEQHSRRQILQPKLSDFFDCCSVFGQRGENQSGFGVPPGRNDSSVGSGARERLWEGPAADLGRDQQKL